MNVDRSHGHSEDVVGSRGFSRRDVLKLGALALAAGAVPRTLEAAGGYAPPPERMIAFFNTHTGERLKAMYCCEGEYDSRVLTQVNHILRDHRSNEIKPIDPRLLDLLHHLSAEVEAGSPFHVISGYRSPGTNTMLRSRNGAKSSVAKHSLHMDGKAIDIRVPGVNLSTLRKAAVSLRGGGVGYYPDLDFVHVDVGRVRYW